MSMLSMTDPPSPRGFSDMNIDQLEQLVHQDLQGGEGKLSDEELMQITGLLAQKKSTPAPAWETFLNHYHDVPAKSDKQRLLWQRLAAAAAALALLISLPVVSLALVSRNTEGYWVSWDLNTLEFHWKRNSIPDHTRWDLNSISEEELQDAGLYPTWIPSGFWHNKYSCGVHYDWESYEDGYNNEDRSFTISLHEVSPRHQHAWSVDGETVQVYRHDRINFYLFRAGDQNGACWVKEGLECSIVGDLSEEQIIKMIHSMKHY